MEQLEPWARTQFNLNFLSTSVLNFALCAGKSHVNARHWSDDKVLEGRAFFRGESNPGRLVLDTLTAADRSELEHSSGGRATLAG